MTKNVRHTLWATLQNTHVNVYETGFLYGIILGSARSPNDILKHN